MATDVGTRASTLVASAVRLIASLVAVVIVLHAVSTSFEANPADPLVSAAATVRQDPGWFTVDLFQFTVDLFRPSEPRVAETIDTTIAALVRVVVGNPVSELIGRPAP
ncbi:hypothetical protein SAMN05660657_05272 [Geodermatophilus amargosae]|uniref:Uncharacterized protein n=1 Tax=Geodermatophilus amargosae TaxID=1296565 RepID=A0A1I7D3G3_9ACTN|nr:hypothetical protein [Geodermatophilus amargosae]SFU06245.1 hypothetical protein SAMN05660657_05272 [Geodermatophilus amargosae]